MNWTFRRVLTLFSLAISLASTAGLAAFFYSLYHSDRERTLLEGEALNIRNAASHLEKLLKLSRLIALENIAESRDIVFALEDPCVPSQAPRVSVSNHFTQHLADLGLDPIHWSNSLDVHQACQEMRANFPSKRRAGGVGEWLLIPSSIQLMVPTVLLLSRQPGSGIRLSLVSVEGFHTEASNTLFLSDQEGKALWTADGSDYLESALADTGVSAHMLASAAQSAFEEGRSRSRWAGTQGLLSYAPIGKEWVIFSLTYAPTARKPISFMVRQTVVLSLGIFLLCFLLGKILAGGLTRPLQNLAIAARRIGDGDFTSDIHSSRLEEVRSVREAFRAMVSRIQSLLRETADKAAIEKDLAVAEKVQQMLIPPKNLKIGGHQVASFMKSAHFVGGDWWGCLEVKRPDGKRPLLLVLVGDATGHGVPPALVAATVRGAETVLGRWIQEGSPEARQDNKKLPLDPREVLGALNRTVFDAAAGTITMTMVAVVFDLEEKRLHLANAAHPFPFLINAKGVTRIGSGGNMLGAQPDTVFEELQSEEWNEGDKLVLYSDGLTEDTLEGEPALDKRQLLRLLKSNSKGGAREILGRILRQWEKAMGGGKQADDVTVVSVEAMAGGGE